MKKTLRGTGATEKTKADYFQITRTSDPVESFDIKGFRKRVEAKRKRKPENKPSPAFLMFILVVANYTSYFSS